MLGSAAELAAMAGLRQPALATSGDDLSALATLTKVPVAELEAMAYRPVARGRHQFLGGVVDRDLISLTPRRACPACLAGKPFHRAAWDFAPVTACGEHGVRLLTACPGCGRLLGWDFPLVSLCPCGQRIDMLPIIPAPAAEVEALAALYDMVEGRPLPWLPSVFAECGRSDLVKATLVIGMAATGWAGCHRTVSLVAAGPDAIANVVVAGVDALRRWPDALGEIRKKGVRPPWVWSAASPVFTLLSKAASKVS